MKLRARNGSVPTGEPTRDGYVIFAVLIVVVVLALVGYRFAESMGAEYRAAVRTSEEAQVKAAALSGLYYAAAVLSNPEALENLGGNPFDNPTAFAQVEVQALSGNTIDRKRVFFSIRTAALAPGSNPSTYTQQYGVIDEGGKLNINSLISLDPTGTTLMNALNQIPLLANNSNGQAIIASIVNWVMPATSTPLPNGADSSSYQSLPNPYLIKNGPLNSLDELLLVQGMDYTLLYGSDTNRNGILDGNEVDNTPGLYNFITVYGRELNVSSTGTARIYLNGELSTIYPQLQQALGAEKADYIVASKLLNTAQVPASGPASSNASAAELDSAVQGLMAPAATNQNNGQRLTSVTSLINTQVTLPGENGAPGLVFPSPLQTTNQSQLAELLPQVMDQCTVQDAIELLPRINVNTAPYEVLISICNKQGTSILGPPTTQSGSGTSTTQSSTSGSSTTPLAETLMTQRLTQMQTPTAQATVSLAWLLMSTNGTPPVLTPAQYQQLEKYITGTSLVYRVQVIGYFKSSLESSAPTVIGTDSGSGYGTGSGLTGGSGAGTGSGPSSSSSGYGTGPVARMEAVIDTNQGAPRFLFIRDLSDIDNPPGFSPGQPLQQSSGTPSQSGTTSQSGTAP